jgi:hypothetical protein
MSEQTFLLILSTVLVVIIVALLGFLSAVLWQLVKILKEVRGIMSNIRLGSDTLTGDLANLRSHIKTFVMGQVASKFASRRKRSKTASQETNGITEE